MTEIRNENISLDDLTPGEEVGFENPRKKLQDINNLADDIAARGLINPIVIWETEKDGESIMVRIAGARREAAIRKLIEDGRANGFSEGVPARVIQAPTLKDAMYAALADNIQRADLSSYEIAMECAKLKTMGDSQKVIAKSLNKSETWVSRKLAALEGAGPALKKAWQTQAISDDLVEDLAKLVKTEKDEDGEVELDYSAQEEMLEEALKDRKGGRKGKSAARNKAKAKAGKATRPSSKVIREMVQVVEDGEEYGLKVSSYTQGVFDALRFAQGSIPLGKLGEDWKEFVKGVMAAGKEKAKEGGEKASSWAGAKKRGKKA